MATARQVVCALAALAAGLLAGCFDEPAKADGAVAPQSRIYMKRAGATTLDAAQLLRNGVDADGRPLAGRFQALDAKTVEYLNLDRNALTNIDAIAAFTSLKWLRLNANKLETLPDMSGLKSLERIYLADNKFKEVPATLEKLEKLESIDLSGNPVAAVPEWLARRKGLKHLSFDHTSITRLPDDISAWKSLKSLKLGELRGMDEAEMRRIRRALPGVRIAF